MSAVLGLEALPFASRMKARVCGLRNALIMSAKFQEIAAKTPFSRPIARAQAQGVFDLVAGFVYSQVLLACVQLKLFEHLEDGPKTLGDLARRMDLPMPAARQLLDAALALRLVSSIGAGRYTIGFRGAAIAGNPAVLSMIEHHAMVYADLADPVALLRGTHAKTGLANYWSYCGVPSAVLPDQRIADYTRLMSRSQSLVAGQVLDAYPVNQHHKILDIGGGDGTFLRSVAARAPGIALELFDLPAVAERARANFAAAGLELRAAARGGNFRDDDLPEGADLITLVRVVHDHDDDVVMMLLHKIRRALSPGGTLLIAEPMSGTRGAESVTDAYFGFYLMAMGSGRPRSAEELTAMLGAAGFSHTREIKTNLPMQTRLLSAQIDKISVNKT
ncbi:MAG: methyltransferase [Hyphomicrobium sp.]